MPSGEASDEELYERWCGPGSPTDRQTAWEELDRRYRRRLLAYCYRIADDWPVAEDCVNDAFLELMRKPRTIRTSFRACLWVIGRNLARRAKKTPPVHDMPPRPESADEPGGNCIAAEERRALESCLARLRPDEREFLLLHACDGLTFEEAASVVGWDLSIPAGKYRYDKALEKLRSCLKKLGFSS